MAASERTHTPLRFPEAARRAVENTQLRRNIGKATQTIRAKRAAVVEEMPDWAELRNAGQAIKRQVMRHLDEYLVRLEDAVTRAGGQVHWARDAEEADRIIVDLVRRHEAREVIKVKSITTEEIRLNEALEGAGIHPIETDLAELIIQLGDDVSSHILVPAIHKNRAEIRELFLRKLDETELTDNPKELTAAARRYLREKFLTVPVAISGANFAVADTGTVCVVESEGNGRMCLTLPKVLISVMGIEKLIPSWQDFEVFLQLLPRSSTGERMNPYNSLWTGITPGDGPQEFHLVLLDNGRSRVLGDTVTRQTLHCIRCSACLNVCPVYSRTGGHAYHSPYQGPIGAIVTPQIWGVEAAGDLPYASTLCGACYEVCPVKINIPEVLVHLRARVVDHAREEKGWRRWVNQEAWGMWAAAKMFDSPRMFETGQDIAQFAQRPFASNGYITRMPGMLSGWTAMRDLKAIPKQTFREWWRSR